MQDEDDELTMHEEHLARRAKDEADGGLVTTVIRSNETLLIGHENLSEPLQAPDQNRDQEPSQQVLPPYRYQNEEYPDQDQDYQYADHEEYISRVEEDPSSQEAIAAKARQFVVLARERDEARARKEAASTLMQAAKEEMRSYQEDLVRLASEQEAMGGGASKSASKASFLSRFDDPNGILFPPRPDSIPRQPMRPASEHVSERLTGGSSRGFRRSPTRPYTQGSRPTGGLGLGGETVVYSHMPDLVMPPKPPPDRQQQDMGSTQGLTELGETQELTQNSAGWGFKPISPPSTPGGKSPGRVSRSRSGKTSHGYTVQPGTGSRPGTRGFTPRRASLETRECNIEEDSGSRKGRDIWDARSDGTLTF